MFKFFRGWLPSAHPDASRSLSEAGRRAALHPYEQHGSAPQAVAQVGPAQGRGARS